MVLASCNKTFACCGVCCMAWFSVQSFSRSSFYSHVMRRFSSPILAAEASKSVLGTCRADVKQRMSTPTLWGFSTKHHRRRLWGGSLGTCPPIIEKRPCIYHFLLPSAPQYLGFPTQYFLQVYANAKHDSNL